MSPDRVPPFRLAQSSRYDGSFLNHDEAEMSMRRRECTAGVGAVALMPRVAYAQQMQRVAILMPSHTQWQPRTFRDALQDLGYREGTNLRLDVISGTTN